MKPLVECIPNYSEARRPEVIDAILASIEMVAGVTILDRHSDLDHNRTVVTMVGNPTAVAEAAFQSIKKAQELIDLNQHEGAHPRIGATDVVPFVPISGLTMTECVEIARGLGKKVANELSIPVYLYEDAASNPDRQNLENIRKGQFEGLKEEIGSNPLRKPDFGPSQLGTAGATVIGARAPLIAFNIYLTSTDLTTAQKIAKTVRNSSGGLRFVKAMGVIVDGRAQVSMNLTNFRQTPIPRVVELVRREASRYGVGIQRSELVGLIPQAALIDTAVWYTQLDGFEPSQILESRLYQDSQKPGENQTQLSSDFLTQLASENPTPGGGSAAAFTAAEACALVAMVGRVTVGKKKYAGVESSMWEMIEQADQLRAELTLAVVEDAQSFESYLAAMRLPKSNETEIAAREDAVETATLKAAQVPHKVAGLAMRVLELTVTAAAHGNLNAISDAASAANLAIAAIRSAGLNVSINVKSMKDPGAAGELIADIQKDGKRIDEIEKEINRLLIERAGISQ